MFLAPYAAAMEAMETASLELSCKASIPEIRLLTLVYSLQSDNTSRTTISLLSRQTNQRT
jgi:hypothetical protein